MERQMACCCPADDAAEAALITPAFEVTAPRPVAQLAAAAIRIMVYDDQWQMGLATALSIASAQDRLVRAKGQTSFMLMAAPSAYPFYRAYVSLVRSSQRLQQALFETHFFQFDDYSVPSHHPASFQFLLRQRLFSPLAVYCDPSKVHFLDATAKDMDGECRRYAELVQQHGPDLQLKGTGVNGHWGFHEPGFPLSGEPQFMPVILAEENVRQQLHDHPRVFRHPVDVPRQAYTANVPLFLRTRELIEDNIPQAGKALALLAAYGSRTVSPRVPSSALKTHHRAIVRTTKAAAWALLDYLDRGRVTQQVQARLAHQAVPTIPRATGTAYVYSLLRDMDIATD